MRRRFLGTAMAATVMSLGLVLGASAPAPAQTNGSGSTIGPCRPLENTIDLGSFNVGQTFTARLIPVCLFDLGASVSVAVNGQSVGTKVGDAGGGVSPKITIVSPTQLSIDDPVVVTGQCGRNTATATGPSKAAQANVAVTGIFTVVCPAAAAVAKGGIAFTGANVAKMAAMALALVIVGALLVRAFRRRRTTDLPA